MRKVFLLVMVCLLLVLSVSCKSKNERILEEVKKNVPRELIYKKDLIKWYCGDRASLTKNDVENTEKCVKIILDTETEYNKKFLSLLFFYNNDNKMSIMEIQILYNVVEEEKLKKAWSKVETLSFNEFDFYDSNDIVKYKVLNLTDLVRIDMSEELGIYLSKSKEIKNNNDIEWQKNTAEELQTRYSIIMEKTKEPEFSDSKSQEYDEDEEKLLNHMKEKDDEFNEWIEEFVNKK